jgi:hypothetical protein
MCDRKIVIISKVHYESMIPIKWKKHAKVDNYYSSQKWQVAINKLWCIESKKHILFSD